MNFHGSSTSTAMGCYDLLHTLGSGNFATVKQAVHVFSGEQVAVKIVDKTKLDAVGRIHLLQEVRCMRLLQHPNIVRLYEIIDTAPTMFLVLELADGGDLYDYMLKNEKAMSEKTARHYFTQIVNAVDYCHQLHVVHRDLKPENVLMFRRLRMVKLTDFGFGHFYQPGTCLDTSCGSLRYSSPEILFGRKYDGPAVDVWGMGILLYAMVCGRPPFIELSDSETISAIMDCRYPLPASLSASCSGLIARMLVKKPENRACLPEIRQHTWLQANADSPEWNGGTGSAGGDVENVSPSSDTPSLSCPLISRRNLSDDAHEWIIKTMLNGGVASHSDEINQALMADEYNNITASYYLLAERLLRSQGPAVAPPIEEEEFIPTALHFASTALDGDQKGNRTAGLLASRRCRPAPGAVGAKRIVDLASVAEMLEELAEGETDVAENVPMETGGVSHPKTTNSPRYSPSGSRRLTSTKSAPHLQQLNKIREEVNADDEEDDILDDAFFLPSGKIRIRERQLTSPERLLKLERSRRQRSRSGSGSSQTSSDTSDNDDVSSTSSRMSASRLTFPPRHRHYHHHRHRSASNMSSQMYHSHSENESPTHSSAPVLFPAPEENQEPAFLKSSSMDRVKRKVPLLQHSQSLMVIPCHSSGTIPDAAAMESSKAARKRHLLHRPHSLPPAPHLRSLFEANLQSVKSRHSDPNSTTSPTLSSFFIRQQC